MINANQILRFLRIILSIHSQLILSVMIYLIALFAVALCASSATVDYHQRRLYYNEHDNCCIDRSDSVHLVVTFEDMSKFEVVIDGQTTCLDDTVHYAGKIKPHEYMYFQKCYNVHNVYKYCDQILFNQKPRYEKIGDKVVSIIQNVTIKNPAEFDEKYYNCVIEGTKTVHHFGPHGAIPAPRVDVTCTHINNIQTETS